MCKRKEIWYKFIFSDGYEEIAMGNSRQEMSVLISKHGALIKKEKYEEFYVED